MKLIDEFLFFSVGFAAKTTEKLTLIVQKLIEQNKMSEAEGKSFVEEYAKKIRLQTEKFDGKMEDFIVNIMQKSSFVKNKDVDAINDRIKKIEDSLNK